MDDKLQKGEEERAEHCVLLTGSLRRTLFRLRLEGFEDVLSRAGLQNTADLSHTISSSPHDLPAGMPIDAWEKLAAEVRSWGGAAARAAVPASDGAAHSDNCEGIHIIWPSVHAGICISGIPERIPGKDQFDPFSEIILCRSQTR